MSMPMKGLPDPMLAREALRGLRHLLRRGGETLRETLPVETLPRPAADLAGVVLREAEALARGVDGAASGLAARVFASRDLSGAGAPPAGLADAQAFGRAFYAAAGQVLARIGAQGFVSEARAQAAFAGQTPDAAALIFALIEAKALTTDTKTEALTLFAVLLWLQSDRPHSEDRAALEAAADLTSALEADVVRAVAARDADALRALMAEFAAHV